MPNAQVLKEHLWKKLVDGPFIMVGLTGPGEHSEPLTAQLDEDQVDRIYFFVGRSNRLAGGGDVTAQFVSKGQDFFASLSGRIQPDQDRAMIDKLWSNAAEAWFPGGKSDPDLTLLRFDISDAELWETDISLSGRLKMLFGGTIDAREAGSHEKVASTKV